MKRWHYLPLISLSLLASCRSEYGRPTGGLLSDTVSPLICPHEFTAPELPHVVMQRVGLFSGLRFSLCGHLLVDKDWLIDPEMAPPEMLKNADVGAEFSPTGEWLSLQSADGWTVRALGGSAFEMSERRTGRTGFGVDRDGSSSHPWQCTPDGLAIVDESGGVQTVSIRNPDCRSIVSAERAPVVALRRSDGRVVIVDLLARTLSVSPMVARVGYEERNGVYGWREDVFVLSPDGSYLFFQEAVGMLDGDTYSRPVGPDEAILVDVATEHVVAIAPCRSAAPGQRSGVMSVPQRGHGFVWSSPERSFLLNARGEVVDLGPVDVLAVGSSHILALRGADVVKVDLSTFASHVVLDEVTGGGWKYGTRVSASAGAIATIDWDGADASTTPRLRVWSESNGSIEFSDTDIAEPLWVGDDGAVLARMSEGGARLFSASGKVLARLPWSSLDWGTVSETAGGLLILMRSGELIWLNRFDGSVSRLAGDVYSFAIDPSGGRVAWIAASAEDESEEGVLSAGRLPDK